MTLEQRIEWMEKHGKTKEEIIEVISNSLCALSLSRNIGEKMDDFTKRNPRFKEVQILLEKYDFRYGYNV